MVERHKILCKIYLCSHQDKCKSKATCMACKISNHIRAHWWETLGETSESKAYQATQAIRNWSSTGERSKFCCDTTGPIDYGSYNGGHQFWRFPSYKSSIRVHRRYSCHRDWSPHTDAKIICGVATLTNLYTF